MKSPRFVVEHVGDVGGPPHGRTRSWGPPYRLASRAAMTNIATTVTPINQDM